jgi:hypothetical protein
MSGQLEFIEQSTDRRKRKNFRNLHKGPLGTNLCMHVVKHHRLGKEQFLKKEQLLWN